jgi:hypothetical protein
MGSTLRVTRSHAVRTRTDGASFSLCLSHLLSTLQDPRGNHVVITIVTALAAASEELALSAVPLLWINLIMDTFATLVFTTDQATEALLDHSPDRHLRAQEVENKDNGDQVHLALRSWRWLRH